MNVAHRAGDTDITVLAETTLSFTPSNWMRPQSFRLQATVDADTVEDSATLTASSASLAVVAVGVSVLDLLTEDGVVFADGFEN